MKAFIFFTIVLVSFSSCNSDDDTAKKEELKKVLADYYNALARKDTLTMKSLTTDNFVLFDEGILYTNESAAKFVADMKPFKVSFTFDSLNIHMDKKDAS